MYVICIYIYTYIPYCSALSSAYLSGLYISISISIYLSIYLSISILFFTLQHS